MKNLIIIPYAEIDGFQTGTQMQGKKGHQDVYWKNACVAAVSCKHHNVDCDVAIVTNITPPLYVSNVLKNNDIHLINCPFDDFNFGAEYIWSLAFYKLCALKYVVESTQYDNYCYMDSDVYVQGSLAGAFVEAKWFILMYYLYQAQPLYGQTARTQDMVKLGCLSDDGPSVMSMGGEFFVASRANAEKYIAECKQIFDLMVAKNFQVTTGDEFISSLAMHRLFHLSRCAQAYVGRFYTRVFRVIPEKWRYHPVPVLHVLGEKEHGMLKLFSSYISKGKIPSNNTVHRILHIKRPAFSVRLKRLYFFTMVKLGRKTNPWQ